MEKEKIVTYNDNDRAIVNALRNAAQPMTLAQINEATGLNLIPGNIVGAMRKHLIVAVGEAEVASTKKSTVWTYKLVNPDCSAKDEKGNDIYTESEKGIVNALAQGGDRVYTLSDMSELVGRKLSSGSINALVNKKGNLVKVEQITVVTQSTKTVKTYAINTESFPANF